MMPAKPGRPAARHHVRVFVLRNGADVKAMLTRSGGRGNPRSAALARAMRSITGKITIKGPAL